MVYGRLIRSNIHARRYEGSQVFVPSQPPLPSPSLSSLLLSPSLSRRGSHRRCFCRRATATAVAVAIPTAAVAVPPLPSQFPSPLLPCHRVAVATAAAPLNHHCCRHHVSQSPPSRSSRCCCCCRSRHRGGGRRHWEQLGLVFGVWDLHPAHIKQRKNDLPDSTGCNREGLFDLAMATRGGGDVARRPDEPYTLGQQGAEHGLTASHECSARRGRGR